MHNSTVSSTDLKEGEGMRSKKRSKRKSDNSETFVMKDIE